MRSCRQVGRESNGKLMHSLWNKIIIDTIFVEKDGTNRYILCGRGWNKSIATFFVEKGGTNQYILCGNKIDTFFVGINRYILCGKGWIHFFVEQGGTNWYILCGSSYIRSTVHVTDNQSKTHQKKGSHRYIRLIRVNTQNRRGS